MRERPNFVVFVPDQLRADAIGAFGNPHVRTPNIDALAARGTRFTNAYAQNPICAPSRASIMTGLYPHTTGHRTQTHLVKPWEPNLLRILKESGYHVTWAGMRGDLFAPGVTELSVNEHGFAALPTVHPHAGNTPEEWPGGDVWARIFYRGQVPDDGRTDLDEATIRTAEQWLSSPPDTPWVLFVPILAPHPPFEVAEPWFSMYDRETLPAPLEPAETTAGEPAYMEAIRKRYGLDRVTPELWQEVVATYYGMVSRMDDHLGRVMAQVDDADTVTLFFTDHGEYLGDHGLVEKWPTSFHPCITRNPLIISGGGLPAGQESSAMVELVDILPTVLEMADISAPHRHFGRSLLPVLKDPGTEHRAFAFTEGGFTTAERHQLEPGRFPYDLRTQLASDEPTLVGKAYAVRDQEWTYVWRLYESPELYDRVDDPGERRNLAGLPAHREVEQRMHQALFTWLVETTDTIPSATDPRLPGVELPAPAPAPARTEPR
ncbi:sulfatase-like hydrolase/transferase [Streptomyces sp. NBC_00250]|uniref:sulfatase-like hydrolase/transferase n=1 Tax=Streptomyces sp. NBC_00250 TaxID=2903641 RepID=UPI002E293C58|nr:sulfatase-like hydrolase/transferase [Streptomyces sp. NBC_00250]